MKSASDSNSDFSPNMRPLGCFHGRSPFAQLAQLAKPLLYAVETQQQTAGHGVRILQGVLRADLVVGTAGTGNRKPTRRTADTAVGESTRRTQDGFLWGGQHL